MQDMSVHVSIRPERLVLELHICISTLFFLMVAFVDSTTGIMNTEFALSLFSLLFLTVPSLSDLLGLLVP